MRSHAITHPPAFGIRVRHRERPAPRTQSVHKPHLGVRVLTTVVWLVVFGVATGAGVGMGLVALLQLLGLGDLSAVLTGGGG